MTPEELHEILDNENKKLIKSELCQTIYDLKNDCFKDYMHAVDTDNKVDISFYSGEINAFQICLDLLEHLEVEE